jgi:GrpB-like predicted nucleotidyltransferase (UPF0157 family)
VSAGEAPIDIVAADPAWPARFEMERQALTQALGPWLTGPVEHIGSTAVSGLPAKPVIDIMAGVSSLDASRPAIDAAAALGYCYYPYRPDSEHWFCKPSPAFRTHHLHLVPFGSEQWRGAIAFRDYLRAHPADAADYAALKMELAQRFRNDREAYTQAKSAFITRLTRMALTAGG